MSSVSIQDALRLPSLGTLQDTLGASPALLLGVSVQVLWFPKGVQEKEVLANKVQAVLQIKFTFCSQLGNAGFPQPI